jgi:hypothetical protein
MPAIRFVWVTLLASFATSFLIRIAWPDDWPHETHEPRYDVVRAVGIWLPAVLIALYDLQNVRRRLLRRRQDLG